MTCGAESVTKRSGASRDGRMLHRPPPLMRIFRPPSAVRSSTITCAGRGGEDGRHQSGGAGADNHNRGLQRLHFITAGRGSLRHTTLPAEEMMRRRILPQSSAAFMVAAATALAVDRCDRRRLAAGRRHGRGGGGVCHDPAARSAEGRASCDARLARAGDSARWRPRSSFCYPLRKLEPGMGCGGSGSASWWRFSSPSTPSGKATVCIAMRRLCAYSPFSRFHSSLRPRPTHRIASPFADAAEVFGGGGPPLSHDGALP